jgi:hypothetical protein
MNNGPSNREIEENQRKGYVYIPSVGFIHYTELPNGPLYDIGADIFEEMAGPPEPEHVPVAPRQIVEPQISSSELIHELLSCISCVPGIFWQKITSVNLIGPLHIVEDDEDTLDLSGRTRKRR